MKSDQLNTMKMDIPYTFFQLILYNININAILYNPKMYLEFYTLFIYYY